MVKMEERTREKVVLEKAQSGKVAEKAKEVEKAKEEGREREKGMPLTCGQHDPMVLEAEIPPRQFHLLQEELI